MGLAEYVQLAREHEGRWARRSTAQSLVSAEQLDKHGRKRKADSAAGVHACVLCMMAPVCVCVPCLLCVACVCATRDRACAHVCRPVGQEGSRADDQRR
jgi:hypothetical protein